MQAGSIIERSDEDAILFKNRKYAQRSLFIIDREGILRYVNYRYRIDDDYPEVLRILEEIGK